MAVVDGLTSPSWNSRRWWRWWEGEAEEVGGGGVGGNYRNNEGLGGEDELGREGERGEEVCRF